VRGDLFIALDSAVRVIDVLEGLRAEGGFLT
jgi:hypothetical protein